MLKMCRKQLSISGFALVLCITGLGFQASANAADWPQWRGPNRDGVCTETGLLKSWPEAGPELMWEISGLGTGYSSFSIVDGKLYTMGDVKVASGKAQCILAYDLSTHQRLWAAEVGPTHGDGPRCTPTYDNGFLYAIGTSGDVVCVEAATGRKLWSKNLQKDLDGGNNPGWKFSESPLIDGDKLLCTPGGRKAVMAALDKKTGQTLWKCSMPDIGSNGKDEAGYSSIIVAEPVNVRQYIQLTNKGVVGVAAKDGRFLWGYNRVANNVANISTPVAYGDYVFCSSAYGTGSALLKLTPSGEGVDAKEVYFLDANTFQNHHGGFVQVGDYIYGGQGHNASKPTCIEIKSGKIMWQQDQPGGGSASVLYADGNLYYRYQDDVMALVEATPDKYNLKGSFKLPKRPGMSGEAWAHPVIANGRLYVRHADVLLVYDIRAK